MVVCWTCEYLHQSLVFEAADNRQLKSHLKARKRSMISPSMMLSIQGSIRGDIEEEEEKECLFD